MEDSRVQYITDADGRETGVIVPISIWRKITSREGLEEYCRAAAPTPSDRDKGGELFRPASTRVGVNEISGLPVFVAPPGAKTLTLNDVQEFESEW